MPEFKIRLSKEFRQPRKIPQKRFGKGREDYEQHDAADRHTGNAEHIPQEDQAEDQAADGNPEDHPAVAVHGLADLIQDHKSDDAEQDR